MKMHVGHIKCMDNIVIALNIFLYFLHNFAQFMSKHMYTIYKEYICVLCEGTTGTGDLSTRG